MTKDDFLEALNFVAILNRRFLPEGLLEVSRYSLKNHFSNGDAGMETQRLNAPNTAMPPPTSQLLMGQYLTIRCAGETLAIDISDVNELIEMTPITRIPMAPDYIRGVINLRGKVVPVIDLPARLAQLPSQLTKRSSMVLVEIGGQGSQQLLGMLVDEVDEILEIEAQHIQPAPKLGQSVRTDFIQAMGNVNGEFIILLAINQLLSAGELEQLSKLAATME